MCGIRVQTHLSDQWKMGECHVSLLRLYEENMTPDIKGLSSKYGLNVCRLMESCNILLFILLFSIFL